MGDYNMNYTIDELTKQVRHRILELGYSAKQNGSHLGGSLSAVELLSILYLKYENKFRIKQNCFILSKGHAAMALYCILESFSFLTKEEVDTFETNGTSFYSHALKNTLKGIEFSGGSLGLGISYAVGVALAKKRNNKSDNVYVLIGDGECNEGIVWEAIMCASDNKLSNLTIIVDNNGLQSDGLNTEVLNTDNLSDKFTSFGCNVFEVDGHNVSEIDKIYSVITDKPKVIIAHTVKGKGVSFLENKKESHHVILKKELFDSALKEIENE